MMKFHAMKIDPQQVDNSVFLKISLFSVFPVCYNSASSSI